MAETVLKRMARPSTGADPAAPRRRLIGRALARAARGAVDLPLTLDDLEEEETGGDEIAARIGDGDILLSLWSGGLMQALACLDLAGRNAVVEARLTGGLLPSSGGEERRPTATDLAFVTDFVDAVLAEITEGTEPPVPLAAGLATGPVLGSAREAALLLPPGIYRHHRFALSFGDGRTGTLSLALPLPREPETAAGGDWTGRLETAVMAASYPLAAVLARLRPTVGEVEAWKIGDLVRLPGIGVSSVRLEGPGGTVSGRGKLGQTAGARAIRIEWIAGRPPPEPEEGSVELPAAAPPLRED